MVNGRRAPGHLLSLERNLGDITRLLELHAKVSKTGGGRLAALQVLNKSAIVLLAACWEAYVEDLAIASFDWLLTKSPSPNVFPNRVRARASHALREDKNELAIWALAGDGWRSVLTNHRNTSIGAMIGTFNSPKAQQVDNLYESLLGIPSLSGEWRWPGMPVDKARRKLDQLIGIRGNIAHRVRHVRQVRRPEVDDYVAFINRLAYCSHIGVVNYLTGITNESPWSPVQYRPLDDRKPSDRSQ